MTTSLYLAGGGHPWAPVSPLAANPLLTWIHQLAFWFGPLKCTVEISPKTRVVLVMSTWARHLR